MTQNSQKIHQETRRKILKILQKTQSTQGGSDNKDRGVYSEKTQENERKPKPAGKKPKPNTQTDPDLQSASGALD